MVEKGQFTDTAMRDKPFCKLWQEKVDEVVEKYRPDMIWFDTRMHLILEPYRLRMAANFYNSALEDGRDLILTYKNSVAQINICLPPRLFGWREKDSVRKLHLISVTKKFQLRRDMRELSRN